MSYNQGYTSTVLPTHVNVSYGQHSYGQQDPNPPPGYPQVPQQSNGQSLYPQVHVPKVQQDYGQQGPGKAAAAPPAYHQPAYSQIAQPQYSQPQQCYPQHQQHTFGPAYGGAAGGSHIIPQQGHVAQQHCLLGQQYVNNTGKPKVLVLTEKKISMGVDSNVTDENGQTLFKFDGKAMSFSDRRLLYDAHRNLVATMRQQHFTSKHTWTVYQGNSKSEVCIIKQDDKGSYSGANIYLPGQQKLGAATATYIVRVQDKGKDFQIYTKQNQLLAEGSRSNKFFSSLMGADRYGLMVQPGVDQAFVLCVCTALDDMSF